MKASRMSIRMSRISRTKTWFSLRNISDGEKKLVLGITMRDVTRHFSASSIGSPTGRMDGCSVLFKSSLLEMTSGYLFFFLLKIKELSWVGLHDWYSLAKSA